MNFYLILGAFLLFLLFLYVYVRYRCSSNGGVWSFWKQSCTCQSGFSGMVCSEKTEQHNKCLENGKWIDGACSCNPGKFGILCERSCSDKNTCSGNGKCSTEGYCICNDGFSGTSCSNPEKCPIGTFIKKPCNGKIFGQCTSTGKCSCRNMNITKSGATNCDFSGSGFVSAGLDAMKKSSFINKIVGNQCPNAKALPSELNQDGTPDYDKIIERIATDLAINAYQTVKDVHNKAEVKDAVKKIFKTICNKSKTPVPSPSPDTPTLPVSIPTSTDNTPFFECIPSTRLHKSRICCEKNAHPVEDSSGNVHCFWDSDPINPLPTETATSGVAVDCFQYPWGTEQEFVRKSPRGQLKRWTLGEDGYRNFESGTVLQRIYGKSNDDRRTNPNERNLAERMCEMENINPKLLAENNTALAYGGCAEIPKGYNGSVWFAPKK